MVMPMIHPNPIVTKKQGVKANQAQGLPQKEIKTEQEAPPAGVPAGTMKVKRVPKGSQPQLPIHRDESDISDVGEDDKPRSPLPKVSVPEDE